MFPSQEFYREELIDGPNVVEDTVRPWHKHPCYGPFAWLDVRGKETTPEGSGSKCNHDEVRQGVWVAKGFEGGVDSDYFSARDAGSRVRSARARWAPYPNNLMLLVLSVMLWSGVVDIRCLFCEYR